MCGVNNRIRGVKMVRDLSKLKKGQLIALGFQNNLQMELVPEGPQYREYLVNKLDALDVIKGLETTEYGQ